MSGGSSTIWKVAITQHRTMPRARPIKTPEAPMMKPSTRKMRRMRPGPAPMALSRPMSRVFSTDRRIKVEAMPSEATKVIKVRMMNITAFSSFSAANRVWFICA